MKYPVLLSLSLLAGLVVARPARAQDRTAEIDEIFGFITPDAPGCAVGVSQRGEVLANRVYGLADLEGPVPLSRNSVFDIGSTHKQFVAAAVLLLAEDGRLSLTDDVHQYLPELPDYGHPITVDHLLTHTSGIRDWTGLLPLAEEGADVLQLILRQRGVNFMAGERWSYSNSGYVLLKEIVARVGERSFAEFARERLFEPLGMTSSAYVEDILHAPGERALAYRKEGDDWTPFMRLGNERGGGVVVSTAGDLLVWNDALTGDRLGEFVTETLEKPATLNNGRALTYAHGLNVDSIPGERLVSHSGSAAGYSTWLGRFTRNGLSVAVLCNFEPVSATQLAARVSDLFLPPADPEAKPPIPEAAPGVDVAGRTGLYLATATGEPVRLVDNRGKLTIAGGPALVPVSDEHFVPERRRLFFRSEDAFELTFESPDEFVLTSMEGEMERFVRAKPWTPAAADLETIDGRYRSVDLGRVFEMLPDEDGLVFRLEQSPDEAIEFEPVARDLYMRRLMTVRFHRDAAGSVTGFDYSNPVVRNIWFERLGDRKEGSPEVAAAEGAGSGVVVSASGSRSREPASRPAPAGPAPELEGLVGQYEMAPGRTLAITLEAGQLYGEPPGSEKRPLIHVSGSTFGVGEAESPIAVTFSIGDDGRATEMVMGRNGRERTLPRVP